MCNFCLLHLVFLLLTGTALRFLRKIFGVVAGIGEKSATFHFIDVGHNLVKEVPVVRNGKVIAIGVASELKMFDKAIDECAKDDNIGIVFILEKGVTPHSGDTVIKYKDTHVIDTSDIVN